jgi:hypothetical protein
MKPIQTLEYIFKNLNYTSTKWDNYFLVYEKHLSQYIGKEIIFVEVGIRNGGSLEMWRKYFGDQARIIGIDINEEALKLNNEGYEIYIGDQSSQLFWDEFYKKVGKIDVLLDDGEHTNKAQYTTFINAVRNTNDDGAVLIEDVCGSYRKQFGNPHPFNFINVSKRIVDRIQANHPNVPLKITDLSLLIYSVHFYNSIVIFDINSKLANKPESVQSGNILIPEMSTIKREKSYIKSVIFKIIPNPIKNKLKWLYNFKLKNELVRDSLHK